jgi:CO/xanthine dehydrogenase FAD-binding subunit
MYAAPFDYVRAASWDDAVARLAEAGEGARPIAGGQSLAPMMLLRLAQPEVLVDIGHADDGSIEQRGSTLVISALARHAELERSPIVRRACPILAEAAAMIGNVRVRNRGTIGGSLAHAEPTAELPCVAVALQATVHARGPSGERAIPASELFVTHLTTSLEPGEVITRVELPASGQRQGWSFVELTRRPGDFALVEVAALMALDEERRCSDIRVVVGAVGDRPADCSSQVAALEGTEPTEASVEEAAEVVARSVDVGPSSHAGPDYRRAMVRALVKRALLSAKTRGQDGR